MSKRQYPRLGSSKHMKAWQNMPERARPRCEVVGCGCAATHKVEIEVSWFRGDDVVAKACGNHINSFIELMDGIVAQGREL